jgi:hypothetical protein
LSLLSLLAGLAAIPLQRAEAQSGVELTPFFATYFPTTSFSRQAGVPLAIFGGATGDIEARQEIAAALGGRFSFPLSGAVRAEAEFAYAFSKVRISQIPTASPTSALSNRPSAHVYFGSARAVFRPHRSNFYMLAGGGLVGRGGEAFTTVTSSKTRLAGVLGVGLRAPVTPGFDLNFGAEMYLYGFSYTSPSSPTAVSRFQSDLLVTVGFPISLR